MKHEVINFTEDGRVHLTTYVLDVYRRTEGMVRPAVIVLPGGGYQHIGTSEGEPVALTFNQLGYNAFVLPYSVGDYSEWPNPLDEVSRAIAYVRDHAEQYQVDPNKIVLAGFSAGANLAGISATQWKAPELAARLGIPSEHMRPDLAIVCYAPSAIKYQDNDAIEGNSEAADQVPGHTGIGKLLTDATPNVGFADYVDADTVPMFLAHTRHDELVPVINVLYAGEKMVEHDREFELHLFNYGHHGMSTNNRISHPDDDDTEWAWQQWVPLADRWVRKQLGMNE